MALHQPPQVGTVSDTRMGLDTAWYAVLPIETQASQPEMGFPVLQPVLEYAEKVLPTWTLQVRPIGPVGPVHIPPQPTALRQHTSTVAAILPNRVACHA